ncbi:50S ribosomal protein L13 [Candidatus Daviesbacteria bacterium]|nr:50S ribosomal protein L13 [Candidatus Daviesbacteria bacterium]
MSTNVLSAKDIKRNWHLVDARGKILGRVATEIASKLTGKNKVNYVPYLDTGDFVIVTNAAEVKVTGNKPLQKTYFRHSGYPGGDKTETFERLIKRRPEEVIRHAVKGMLPKTKLGDKMIKKLYVFAGNKHPFAKQLGVKEEVVETVQQ